MRLRTDIVVIRRHLDDMRMRGLSQTYIDHRRRVILRMERRVGKPALKVTADDLDVYQRALPGVAGSRAAELIHLGQWFRWATRTGHLRCNPATVLIRPQRARRVPRPMPENAVAAAISNAPPRIRPMLVLMAYSGLRCCEVAGLDRSDVFDQQDPPLLIVRGKGGKERAVPLGQTVLDALTTYGMPARGPVFPRLDGRCGRLSGGQVSTITNRYLRSVGVTDTSHAMRHRFASRTYAATKDIRAVQTLLGHASPQTTAGYAAVIPDSLTTAVRALDNLGV